MEENNLIVVRRQKLEKIAAQETLYPNKCYPKNVVNALQEDYKDLDKESLEKQQIEVSVAGRLMAKRGPFFALTDASGKIQLYTQKHIQELIKDRYDNWDIGDILYVEGVLARSNKGDLYIDVVRFTLLTKSLRPLPEKYHSLKDTETRYRQRYLDLIMNDDARDIFRLRSKIISYIRSYMDRCDFMEVETPMLHSIPGGATAAPFVTHHNALDMPMFLRIAPELYLKRLIVGGFNRIYEINRNFRNEGVSTRHNPEFTMLEFYQAYSTYEDLMLLLEDFISSIVKTVHQRENIVYQGYDLDFSKPFVRMTLLEAIAAHNHSLDMNQLKHRDAATKYAETLKIQVKKDWGLGKIQLEIFEKTAEHQLIEPTFITHYPAEVSPLARVCDTDNFLTERFELFIAGYEIANGFSELNDPVMQEQRFREQVQMKDNGDDEAMHFDSDYVQALEYGMPPTAGCGLGIDRLIMLLTNSASIREVLFFPHMRPEK